MQKTLTVLATSLAIATMAVTPALAKNGIVEDRSNQGIVGMWVEVEGGQSGWAKLSGGEGGSGYYKFWNYDTQGKRFQVDIGYSGTPAHWGKSIRSDWIDTNYEHVDFTIQPKMFIIPLWYKDELIVKYR